MNITKIAAASLAVLTLASCSVKGTGTPPPSSSAQEREAEVRQSNLNRLASAQPAQTMSYSPTRATVNFWMETWDEPGKLSYVYLSGSAGNLLGYYVLEGLPVSYCVGITQPYDIIRVDTANIPDGKGGDFDDADAVVAAPGMDGAYYGGCNDRTYYGKDATTGSYLEWTVGMGQNVFLYDQPQPRQDVEPLGYTLIEDDGTVAPR